MPGLTALWQPPSAVSGCKLKTELDTTLLHLLLGSAGVALLRQWALLRLLPGPLRWRFA